ncbi:MAG: exo-alpha-sialidase [Candidatus Hydrogenedentes bacterium]|nr:exo-alpha-sialidase [Candidatus Hydrogenedentota bacterium]
MRTASLFLFALAVLLIAPAAPADTSHIFPLQDKHVHSSSIVQCPNGDILATWFYGTGERSANDVRVQGARLKKGASEWSPVFEMADTPDLPDCNPVLFIDANEKLWLFWLVVHTNRWERGILKYKTSTNYQGEGAPVWDWQDIILLKPGKTFADDLKAGFEAIGYPEHMWAEYAKAYTDMLAENAADPVKTDIGWMTRTPVLTLKSGRILIPLYSDGFNVSLAAYSDDQGATWAASKPIVGLGNIQPAIVEREDGTLMAYMRDNGVEPKRIIEASSKDGGETWSIGTDMEFKNSGGSVSACAVGGGRWVLVYNDAEQGRHNLAISLSEDEGKTWTAKKMLENSDNKDSSFGYPTVLRGADGNIHLSYTLSVPGGKTIKYSTFTVESIKN